MKCAYLAMALLVGGCVNLSPEQMRAMEGTSANLCIQVPAWNGSPGTLSYSTFGGRSVGTAGGSGKVECGASKIDFNNEGKLAPIQKP